MIRGLGRRKVLVFRREDVIAVTTISDTREVSLAVDLPPPDPERPFVVVPFTYEPGESEDRVWGSGLGIGFGDQV